jgi:hypothetical protein
VFEVVLGGGVVELGGGVVTVPPHDLAGAVCPGSTRAGDGRCRHICTQNVPSRR